ncbi:MAG: hypothetical protein RIS86_1796 [Planctomycetota bacterium]|jgi:hypothetical protein
MNRIRPGRGAPARPEGGRRAGDLLRWMRGRKGALALVAMFAVVAWAKPMGLLLWARIRILTSIPKTAIADDPAQAPAADEPPPELETGLPVSSEGASGTFDPFRIDPNRFPTSDDPPAAPPEAEPAPKSDGPTADDLRLEAIDMARRASERFRLQSAGKGLAFAVIDGRTHRIGDLVEGVEGITFTLLEVREGSALLGHGGETFEIRLR